MDNYVNNDKILHISSPLLNSLPRDNHIFTILNNNKKILELFIFHNYIDSIIIYDKKSHDYYMRFEDSTKIFIDNRYFNFSFISREILTFSQLNICDMIVYLINLGYYILLPIDTNIINSYKEKMDFSHELMIVGYNQVEKYFFINDFFDGVRYTTKKCSFEEIIESFSSHYKKNFKSKYDGLLAVKLKTDYDEKIDYLEIKNKLEKYLKLNFKKESNKNYGISIFDTIIEQLTNPINYYAPLDFLKNKLNFIKNTINLMIIRTNLIDEASKGIIKDGLIKLLKRIEFLLNLCLKYIIKDVKSSTNVNKKFIDEISNIKIEFIIVMNNFLKAINFE